MKGLVLVTGFRLVDLHPAANVLVKGERVRVLEIHLDQVVEERPFTVDSIKTLRLFVGEVFHLCGDDLEARIEEKDGVGAHRADVDAEMNRAIDWLQAAGVDTVIVGGQVAWQAAEGYRDSQQGQILPGARV